MKIFLLTRNQKIAIALAIVIFIADMLIPLGVSVGALYVFAVLLVSYSSKTFIAVFSSIICFLVAFKFYIYVNDSTTWMIFANRILSMLLVIIATFFSIKFSDTIWLGFVERDNHAVKEKYFTNIIENLLEGAQLISYDWRYLYINKSLESQIGQSRHKLIGKKMTEVYPGIENSELFKKLQHCMLSRKTEIFYNKFEFPDGRKEVFELNVHAVNDGLFVLSMVVTDKVKIEEERQSYTKNLEQMLFITSHKIRQPVTNILGLTDWLSSDKSISEDAKKVVNYINDSAEKLDQFTHELNDFIVEKSNQKKH